MTWQGIDFLGISLNDASLVQKLDEFLNSHEEYISKALVLEIKKFANEAQPGESSAGNFRSAAREIEGVLKEIPERKEGWQDLIRTYNTILWEQVELLEGFVNELFHQLSYASITKWKVSLKESLQGFSKVLNKHIKLTREIIASLKLALSGSGNEKAWYQRFLSPWSGGQGLEEELESDLTNCENILEMQTNQFIERFETYQKVAEDVDKQVQKLNGYEILNDIGTEYSQQFESLYFFLKLWEGLVPVHSASNESVLKSFQQFSRDKTFTLLKKYHSALETALYDKSRTLKASPRHLFTEFQGRSFLLETVRGYQKEVHTLGSTISKLRDFLLRSHPDPYVRARWGFADSPVGEPPRYAKMLNDLNLSVEQLDLQYKKLIGALEAGPTVNDKEKTEHIEKQISRALHTLAQPLISSQYFKTHADHVLELLDEMNELGAYGRECVDYTRYVMGRLLRADWKDHLITSNQDFKRLYWQHSGIIGPSIDQGHDKRMEKFQQLLRQVRSKIRQEHHSGYDVEYDISDLKGYLQDFFATLQRATKDQNIGPKRARRHVEEGAQQLLEYRYQFGEFFMHLKEEPEGYYIRQQFFFADQYFEAIENTIYEMRLQRGLVTADDP
ncbi:MAG: hypothetical protein WC222_01020 [Parachlamydiales bacterium]|jgi:hypothetical protein